MPEEEAGENILINSALLYRSSVLGTVSGKDELWMNRDK